jgi:hypothetical protein
MTLAGCNKVRGNGRFHPRTDHEEPEVEWGCNCILSLTSALDRGGWSTQPFDRFTLGKDPVPIV